MGTTAAGGTTPGRGSLVALVSPAKRGPPLSLRGTTSSLSSQSQLQQSGDQDMKCVVCWIIKDTIMLGCGHYVHSSCLEKHFKAECPFCRTPQTIVIPCGTIPGRGHSETSTGYVRSTAHSEKIITEIKGPFEPDSKIRIEYLLTRKHRGEKLSRQEETELKTLFTVFYGINIIIVRNDESILG